MRILWKLTRWGVAVLVLLLLAGAAWLCWLGYSRRPDLGRTVHHPSLTSAVRVVRDDWGIPHIRAETEPDGAFALGYCMGQDRLFQMELMRRLAAGELSAMLGKRLVPVDAVIRSFRLRTKAEAYFADKSRLPAEVLASAEAFVAGINHAMVTEPKPLEMTLLGLPLRPFTLVDCLSVSGLLPITFSEALRTEPLVSMIHEEFPEVPLDELFPGYGKGVPATVMESLEEAAAYLQSEAAEAKAPAGAAPPGEKSGRLDVVLAALNDLRAIVGPRLGSNSWVLSGERSASGKPILANDPHIAFTNPGIWYEAHVRAGEYEMYGHFLPLIPFALLGHNARYGWAITMFANDDVSLYRETFHPEDPNLVMYKGEWAPVEVEIETIPVRFGASVEAPVRITPHGPIVTDLFRALMDYEGPDVAMSWVWQHLEHTDLLGFWGMNHAEGMEEFAEAVSLFTSPGLNISYADREGNIAWWAAGRIPILPNHVNHMMLLDGASGNDEVLGYLPFSENPHLVNPPSGCIVTANNKSTVRPVGPMGDLQGHWQPDDRARRIEELLDQQEEWTVRECAGVQFDDHAAAAPAVVAAVLRAASEDMGSTERIAVDLLRAWDGGHGKDSAAASIYQVLTGRISANLVADEIGERYEHYRTLNDHWNMLKHAVATPDHPFWDDVSTPGVESQEDILRVALKETVAMLSEALGEDPAAWHWGRLHTMEFKHPLGYLPVLDSIFNIGPFPASGGNQIVNNMLCLHDGDLDFDVVAGPSTRRLVDFAEPHAARTILPTGNSGILTSPHYDDNAGLFMNGAYRIIRYTDDLVEAHARHEMWLRPAPGSRG